MNLWQIEGPKDPIIKLVRAVGLERAALELKRTKDEVADAMATLRYLHDFSAFAQERLWIQHKQDSSIVPFKINTPQKKLNAAIEKQRLAGRPVRIRMLKARQWGGSTMIQGLLYRDAILRPSRNSMTVAHSIDSANHLREISGRYHDRYNWPKPEIKKTGDKLWRLGHKSKGYKVDSTIRIDTAENLAAGHSFTLHNLHLSEIQKWPHAGELVRGLYPTVPNTSDTMIFEEGTGSGVGDYWYDSVQAAMGGLEGWEFVFVAWYEEDDTERPFENGSTKAQFEKTLDDDEKALRDLGVPLEKLNWRRFKLTTDFKNDPDGFKQQYPSTADEAFLTSGRPVFPSTQVKKKLAQCKPPVKRGFLRWKTDLDKKKTVVFDEDPLGYWEIFEELPKPSKNLYVLGIDVSEGIAVIPELGNRGGDFSTVKGLRRDVRTFPVKLKQRLDPDILADEVHKCSVWLGGNQVVGIFPEQNAGGGGNVVISRLKDTDCWLLKTPVFGKKRDFEKQDEYGWETMVNTKREAIDTLNEEIRENSFVDLDRDFWYECSTYVRDEKGRTNAQKGKYDDLVMAEAIAFQGDRLMPMVFKDVKKEKEKYARDRDVPQNLISSSAVTRESVMENSLAEF